MSRVMNKKCCDDSALSQSAFSGTELNSNADSTYSTIVWPGAVLESAQLDQVYISRLICVHTVYINTQLGSFYFIPTSR